MKLKILTNVSKPKKEKESKKVVKKRTFNKKVINYDKPFLREFNFSRKRNFYVKLNEENRGHTPNLSLGKTYKVFETIICEHEDYLTASLVIRNNNGDKRNYLAHNFIEVKL